MKELLKSSLIKMLAIAGAFPTRMTNRTDLLLLLKRLHPVSTNRGLIRLGPRGDGGYLVPNDLAGIEACFSPGVSSVSGFEEDCTKLGMDAFLADKSVDQPAAENERFHFTKKFVGAVSNDDFMTLDDWVTLSPMGATNSDLLLQMDIEGHEYEVFLSTSGALMRKFRIIVAEFHQLDQLWNWPFYNLASRAFERILESHTCVHIHPNNCCGSLRKDGLDIPRVMEFTFLRTDRIERSSYQSKFPNPLDFDNTSNATLTLPECWHSED